MLPRLIRRFRYWWNREDRANSFTEEMQFHLEMKIEELMEDGMSEPDARDAARKQFGNLTRQQEEAREAWLTRWLSDLVQDVTYATRSIRKQPGFATVAILSAALGIGACSLIFAIANFALFRTLPVEEPSHLVNISGKNQRRGKTGTPLTYPDFEEIRKAESLIDAAAVVSMIPAGITTTGDPQRYWGSIVTANYFDVVQPKFTLGRGFDSKRDHTIGEAPVVVLSDQLWKSRFEGNPNILGKDIELNGRKATVIGITGPGFRGEDSIFFSQFWVPFSMLDSFPQLGVISDRLLNRNFQWLSAVGRLRPQTELTVANAEIETIAQRLATSHPGSNKDRLFHIERAGQAHPGVRQLMQLFFLLLLGASVLVLITACANVANLLLARASSRRREIATRLAIGAGRGRLIRQLLTESILLGLMGGIGGYGIATLGVQSIRQIQIPLSMPIDLGISLDHRVVLFCIGISALTGIVFGLVPALRATGFSLTGALKDEHNGTGSMRRFSLRNALVVAQVAICTVLLICSGLFLRSFHNAGNIHPGFSHRNLLMVTFDPSLNHSSTSGTNHTVERILQNVQKLPGVEASTITNAIPLNIEGNENSMVEKEQATGEEASSVTARIISITPRFFETLGINMLFGEDFTDRDATANPAIVNHVLANQFFPNQNPLGRRIRFGDKLFTIRGVAATTKTNTLGEGPTPALYLPLNLQSNSLMGITLLLRTEGSPVNYSPAVRQLMRDIDPSMAISNIRTMEMHLSRAMIVPRTAAWIFGLTGVMGLIIAIVGLYGVISFAVAQRTKEIGIRMALGSTRQQVINMILSQGFTLTLFGSIIGFGVAFAVTRTAVSLLYGISPTDIVTFISVPVLLLVIALVACFLPAKRAASLDPASTLKYE